MLFSYHINLCLIDFLILIRITVSYNAYLESYEDYEANFQLDPTNVFLDWACLHLFKSNLELLDFVTL